MILLSEMKIRKFFLPNWSWARQPLSSARSTLLYPFQMLNAKQGSSNSHLLTSFGMTRPGIEPTTSRLWGGRSTDWANTIWMHFPFFKTFPPFLINYFYLETLFHLSWSSFYLTEISWFQEISWKVASLPF